MTMHGMRMIMVSLENDEGIELSVTGTLRDVTEISPVVYYSRSAGRSDPAVLAVHLLDLRGVIRVYTGNNDQGVPGFTDVRVDEAVEVAEALKEAAADLASKLATDPLDELALGAVVAFGDKYEDQFVCEKRSYGWCAVGDDNELSTKELVDHWRGDEPRVLFKGFSEAKSDGEDEY
jgi:hypothetical protein